MATKTKKKPTRKLKRPCEAAKKLEQFVGDNNIKLTEAAKALHCTHPALIAWFSGTSKPTARYRKNIEAWTNGAIPESAWEKGDDVAPFAPTGTEGS